MILYICVCVCVFIFTPNAYIFNLITAFHTYLINGYILIIHIINIKFQNFFTNVRQHMAENDIILMTTFTL